MNFDQYQVAARRTQNPALTYEEKRNHALFGLCSEVGEIHGIYQKDYQGHGVDKEKVKDELSDVFWFCAELCDSVGLRMDDVALHNIHKLEKRYKNGFTEEESIHRAEYGGKPDTAGKAPEVKKKEALPLEKVLKLFPTNCELLIHPYGQDAGLVLQAGMAGLTLNEKCLNAPVRNVCYNDDYDAIEVFLGAGE